MFFCIYTDESDWEYKYLSVQARSWDYLSSSPWLLPTLYSFYFYFYFFVFLFCPHRILLRWERLVSSGLVRRSGAFWRAAHGLNASFRRGQQTASFSTAYTASPQRGRAWRTSRISWVSRGREERGREGGRGEGGVRGRWRGGGFVGASARSILCGWRGGRGPRSRGDWREEDERSKKRKRERWTSRDCTLTPIEVHCDLF